MYPKQIALGVGLAILVAGGLFLASNAKAIDCHYAGVGCYDDDGTCNKGYYCHPVPTSLPVIGGCSGDKVYVSAGDDCGTCVRIAWPHIPQGDNCGPSLGVEDYLCW